MHHCDQEIKMLKTDFYCCFHLGLWSMQRFLRSLIQCLIVIVYSSSLYPFGMWTKVQFLGCDGELSF